LRMSRDRERERSGVDRAINYSRVERAH
jgi:hypothetical protein